MWYENENKHRHRNSYLSGVFKGFGQKQTNNNNCWRQNLGFRSFYAFFNDYVPNLMILYWWWINLSLNLSRVTISDDKNRLNGKQFSYETGKIWKIQKRKIIFFCHFLSFSRLFLYILSLIQIVIFSIRLSTRSL